MRSATSRTVRAETQNIAQTFDVVPGLSDHTMGITVPVTAVPLGAKIIEKHMTLDRNLGGPDAKFSLEPQEFKEMVKSVRDAEKAIGKVTYELNEKQKRSRDMSRSIFAVKTIEKGEKLTEENISVIRPMYGLNPKHFETIIGMKAKEKIERGAPLKWENIE